MIEQDTVSEQDGVGRGNITGQSEMVLSIVDQSDGLDMGGVINKE